MTSFSIFKLAVTEKDVPPFPSTQSSEPPSSIIYDNNVVSHSGPSVVGSVNLLDWDDNSTINHQQTSQSHDLKLEEFRPDTMTPQIFQSKWMSLPETINAKIASLQLVPQSPTEIETILRSHKVRVDDL